MPRKKDSTDWKPDDRGRYRRIVGWRYEGPKRVPQPFYLGTNLDQAKARHLRLKELWAHVVEAQRLDHTATKFEPLGDDFLVWKTDSLWIAKEIAAGNVQIVVPAPDRPDPSGYAARVASLAKRFPMVHFAAEDPEAYRTGMANWEVVVSHEAAKYPRPQPNAGHRASRSLHQALDAYAEHIRKTDLAPTPEGPRLTAFGNLKTEQARHIKERQSDRPLSSLDFQGCQELLDYWRLRPATRPRHGKPPRAMARKTCENHVAELMRFFRWLHKAKDFDWRTPEDFGDLDTKIKDIADERTSIEFLNVRVYSLDELALLNKYATPLERLLLLLGLNCGFKGAEQGTLRLEHLFLDRPHPHAAKLGEIAKFPCRPEDRFILYSRNKSKVYGEFLLWSQTADGLRWAIERRERIRARLKTDDPHLLLTDQGMPFFRRTGSNKNQSQIFMNKWHGLIKRIRKDHPDFPSYGFSSLRDTAADRIRHIAGGEVASVFLCHGKPVRQDNLLDLYTNRPFGGVFKALRQLEEDLKPVFDAAPSDPWEQPMQQYTSLGTREKILELHDGGLKVSEIAERTGKSLATIYRQLGRRAGSKTGLR